MSRWFNFSEPEFQFRTLEEIRRSWSKIPGEEAKTAIAEGHQYYDFLTTMVVDRVQSWSHPLDEREHWHKPSRLDLSARAGAIASAIIVGTSIIECAMRAHAESRKMGKVMKVQPERRTFGKLITVWSKHGDYSKEIDPVFEDMKKLQARRNNIHLYARFGRRWEDVLEEEDGLKRSTDRLIEFFQGLEPK
ncbi:hypothetical protein [Marinobacter salarius]|uniref:hypothetical protein n=1 Tax=Marinobacter salarius TaxID=1420917 RepID=UPI000F8595DF|nr:hypothetical protein [Marinobacter salarius]AZR41997.1 hypothetical protein MTMN5_02549 [Marinobacter salarius]